MPSSVIGRGLGYGLATASAAAFAMPSLGMPSFASDISAPRPTASSYSLVAGSPPPSARLARSIASGTDGARSEEHTSELQSLMRISYAFFCLKKKNTHISTNHSIQLDCTQHTS